MLCYDESMSGTNLSQSANVKNRRPSLRQKNYTEQIGLMVSKEMDDQLYELAKKNKCTIQEQIRYFINLGFQNENGKN